MLLDVCSRLSSYFLQFMLLFIRKVHFMKELCPMTSYLQKTQCLLFSRRRIKPETFAAAHWQAHARARGGPPSSSSYTFRAQLCRTTAQCVHFIPRSASHGFASLFPFSSILSPVPVAPCLPSVVALALGRSGWLRGAGSSLVSVALVGRLRTQL